MHPKLQKLVAVAAREQGGDVVDLDRAERDVRIAVCQVAIEEVWEAFGAGLIEADPAEEMLRNLEYRLFCEAVFGRPSIQPSIAEMRAAQPAAHRAARGVRKVRGAK